jgi:hypothetical protein
MTDDLVRVLTVELSHWDEAFLAQACEFIVEGYKADDLGTSLGRESGPTIESLVLYARAEVYKLLCTKNERYRNDRQSILAIKTSFVGFLTGAITMKFGISEGTATAVAAVALFLPIKIGLNAWCAMYKDTALSRIEQKALKDKAGDAA